MTSKEIYKSYIKSPYKTIKHSTYFDSYEEIFSKYRNTEFVFLEIGVLGGGSLFMWRDYFGPKARIIGVDLNPQAKKWESEGFEIYIGSQSSEDFWSNFFSEVGMIDVVLDDGGHTYEQQIITTECLLPAINDGGMIVIEDTHTSYMNGFGPKSKSFIEYTKAMIDNVNKRFGRFDNGNSERRVWSIEIFESIVCFKVDRASSNLLSEPTNNGGADDNAKDYRYVGNEYIATLSKFQMKLRLLKYIPFSRKIFRFLKEQLANKSFGAEKYFKR